MKAVSVTDLLASCSAILDEIGATGETVAILKDGKLVAHLVAPVASLGRFPQRELAGTVEFLGNVVAPVGESDKEDESGGP